LKIEENSTNGGGNKEEKELTKLRKNNRQKYMGLDSAAGVEGEIMSLAKAKWERSKKNNGKILKKKKSMNGKNRGRRGSGHKLKKIVKKEDGVALQR